MERMHRTLTGEWLNDEEWNKYMQKLYFETKLPLLEKEKRKTPTKPKSALDITTEERMAIYEILRKMFGYSPDDFDYLEESIKSWEDGMEHDRKTGQC